MHEHAATGTQYLPVTYPAKDEAFNNVQQVTSFPQQGLLTHQVFILKLKLISLLLDIYYM